MSGGSAKPMLRRVASAALHGMSEEEIASEQGFEIMLAAMRAAYNARYLRADRVEVQK